MDVWKIKITPDCWSYREKRESRVESRDRRGPSLMDTCKLTLHGLSPSMGWFKEIGYSPKPFESKFCVSCLKNCRMKGPHRKEQKGKN